MRVFNLTDVPTPALRSKGLVNTSLTVCGTDVAPGGEAEVSVLTAVEYKLVACGAISMDERPASYLRAKAEQLPPIPPAPHEAPTTPPPPPAEPEVEEGVEEPEDDPDDGDTDLDEEYEEDEEDGED